jgi:chemotaxis protein CheD
VANDNRGHSRTIVVKMAEMVAIRRAAEEPVVLKTTLGSCVGVILVNKKRTFIGLAHIMLPHRVPDDEAVGKYADTALPELLARMEAGGLSGKSDLEALVIGGACMFHLGNGASITDIGSRNIEAVHKTIEELSIPIVYEDTGGTHGRTVTYDCRSAEVTVRSLKKPDTPAKDRILG